MKSPVLLLSLLALVHTAPLIEEYLLFEPPAGAEPPPLVPIPQLCTQLGLNTFVQLIKENNLYSFLEASPPRGGEFTLFVPSEAAFQNIPQDIIDKLMKNKTLLMEALTFHIVLGKEKLFLRDFGNDYLYTSLSMMDVRTNKYNVSQPGKGSKMVYLATGAPISKPDNLATNGAVHVIDDVMFLPVRTSAEVINVSPDLSGVAQLFNVTGLSQDLLSGERAITVFAPVKEAFEALPQNIKTKIKNDQTYAAEVAYTHTVDGTFYEVGLYNGQHLPVVPYRPGSPLTVTISNDKIMVNDAEVITTNFTTAGGIIHGINKVLLPQEP